MKSIVLALAAASLVAVTAATSRAADNMSYPVAAHVAAATVADHGHGGYGHGWDRDRGRWDRQYHAYSRRPVIVVPAPVYPPIRYPAYYPYPVYPGYYGGSHGNFGYYGPGVGISVGW